MNILLDTHVLLWHGMGNTHRLKSRMREMIADPRNQAYISIVSFWEIAIKKSINKLEIEQTAGELQGVVVSQGAIILPIRSDHIARVETMLLHHRDPFDRMLVAQAIVEKLPIMSSDKKLDAYEVTRIWG